MTHEDVAISLAYLYPGVEWSYDGDGSTLDPVYDSQGDLVSRGLEWHGSDPAPTLDTLQNALPNAVLASDRVAKRDQILASIATTDLWCIRHVEDGISLTDARKTYRENLRTLLESVDSSTDPSSIAIPDPPAYP